MILMPFYGDQYSNAAAAQTRGVAVILEFNDFTEEKLRNALDQIFNDTRYVSLLRLFLNARFSRSDREFKIPPVVI